jgi:hypothetical protein
LLLPHPIAIRAHLARQQMKIIINPGTRDLNLNLNLRS